MYSAFDDEPAEPDGDEGGASDGDHGGVEAVPVDFSARIATVAGLLPHLSQGCGDAMLDALRGLDLSWAFLHRLCDTLVTPARTRRPMPPCRPHSPRLGPPGAG